MSEFVEVTHYHTGEDIHLRISQIEEIRQRKGKTLVVMIGKHQGQYVVEFAHDILIDIEAKKLEVRRE